MSISLSAKLINFENWYFNYYKVSSVVEKVKTIYSFLYSTNKLIYENIFDVFNERKRIKPFKTSRKLFWVNKHQNEFDRSESFNHRLLLFWRNINFIFFFLSALTQLNLSFHCLKLLYNNLLLWLVINSSYCLDGPWKNALQVFPFSFGLSES